MNILFLMIDFKLQFGSEVAVKSEETIRIKHV